jgi:tetratricopeptide (TPR) repeat protein
VGNAARISNGQLILMTIGFYLFVSQIGCRITAPVYVWSKPRSNQSSRLAVTIGHIEGNTQTANDFCNAFREQRPQSQEKVAVLTPSDLIEPYPVQLASTSSGHSPKSEIGAMQAARISGSDLLLMGEILRDELTVESPASQLPPEVQSAINLQSPQAPLLVRRPEHLTIAWRAIDTVTGERLGTFTTIVDRNQADEMYPELVWQYPDPRARVMAVSARETWKSISPHVIKEQAKLTASWVWPGSAQIRKGVVLAKNQRWLEAEEQWEQVVEQYPEHHGAWHNLALAAVAREDFSAAKKRIRRALELSDNRHYQKSFQWIELRQREYYQAFNLPDPIEGWAFPDPGSSTSVIVDQVRPIDLDSQPWYQIVPGIKPPEWSWYAWLTQPIPF